MLRINGPTKFQELTAKVWEAQLTYSKFGACDTEPDAEIQQAVVTAAEHGIVRLPTNWQLFTASMDCQEAEKALNETLEPLLEYVAELGRVRQQIIDFCWRIY